MRRMLLRRSRNYVRRSRYNNEIQTAQQNYDLEKAAELQYGSFHNLQKSWAEEET